MFPVAPPVDGQDWLNSAPVQWSDLSGRVIVLVFWSFGCEASLLALRDLKLAREGWSESADDVVIVAVHTPRFPYEDDSDAVRAAIARHEIDLHVVHDPEYITWNRYNPEGWPAMAVINRRGRVMGISSGAASVQQISEAVMTELATTPSRLTPQKRRSGELLPPLGKTAKTGQPPADHSTLRFPAGLTVTPSGQLVVADTGNNRLLVGDLDSDLRTLRPTMEITDIEKPTALACASDTIIYVVESGSGSVLQVDLNHGALDVLADDELLAPTALAVDVDSSLVIADAGQEQLFRIVGGTDGQVTIGPIAGSGVSGCRDGVASRAELAQPVAMVRTNSGIAFCDAASSNIRLLTDSGEVLTITGNEFYDWGLVDGPAHRARLQRPSGLCLTGDGAMVIADAGNDRLRLLADRRITTLGLKGLKRPTALHQLPSGHLVVVDTENHRLVMADTAMKTSWPVAVYPAVMTSVWEPAP